MTAGDKLGTLLNQRYKIVRVLGSGGFGQTYVAEDTRQKPRPKCVVKQFKPAIHDAKVLEVARRLFFSEVETLRRLGSHDQIPALIDDFEEDQEFYLVQEYIEGRPLSDELTLVKRLSEENVLGLLRDILTVLGFVHGNQVIHRDIKPSNLIRRQQDNTFVLIDFGAVKEIQTQITAIAGHTNLTVGIGTQGYGASEQLAGKPRYNSDLYALGMTAIHALTGTHPSQLPTHPDTGEVIWRDRVQVSPHLAAILDRMVRYHFGSRFQSATEVLQALDSPADKVITELTELPPTLLHQPPEQVVTDVQPVPEIWWQALGRAMLFVGGTSGAIAALVLGVRHLGWLVPQELAVYDRMVQIAPDPGVDSRLLVVGVTEADIQAQQRFPLSDQTIAQAIAALKPHQPRAIGIDFLRDIPQPPGRADLLTAIKDPQVIVIKNLGSSEIPATPPPAGVAAEQVGFNDLPLDEDGVVRRNLLFADRGGEVFYSFGLRLALAYLRPLGLELTPANPQAHGEQFRLGKSLFSPLDSNAGGYQGIDAGGYQILLKYRSRRGARQISLEDLLQGRLKPEWVRDKVVLLGTTAPSAKDVFFTPYSPTDRENPRTPGVLLHAQMVSQFLSAAMEGSFPVWFWSEWGEGLWIGGWAILSGSLAWILQGRRWRLVLTEAGLLLLLIGSGFGLFLLQAWVPIAAPAWAIVGTAGVIAFYHPRK